MDFSTIPFLPQLKINEFKDKVEKTTGTEKTTYTDIERSEALESLGIAQFHNGDIINAVANLEASISQRFIKLKSKKRLSTVKMLLGSIYYRFGDLSKAEQVFQNVIELSKKSHDNIMCSTALCNIAITQLRLENFRDALKNSRMAIDMMTKIYSKQCSEYLQAIRISVCIHLKMEDFAKAESLVEEHEFPPREKALILAGIKFAQYDHIGAAAVLTKCLDIEYGETNGFKAPILGKLGEVDVGGQSVGDKGNPWSKWSNSNIDNAGTGSGASTVGKAGTPTASGARTPKVNKTLIQPMKSYIDDVNNEVMIAMIQYNLALLQTKDGRNETVSEAVETLRRFVTRLSDHRRNVNIAADRTHTLHKNLYENGIGPYTPDDPYLTVPYNKHPAFMSLDAYLYPAVVLSTLLTTQSEVDILTTTFTSGLSIEAGQITSDVAGLDLELRQLQQLLQNATYAIQSTLPANLAERTASAQQLQQQQSAGRGSGDTAAAVDGVLHHNNMGEYGLTDYNTTGQNTGQNTGYTSIYPTEPNTAVNSTVNTARSRLDIDTTNATANNTRPSSPLISQQPSENSINTNTILVNSTTVTKTDRAELKQFQELPDIAHGHYTTQKFQILKDLITGHLNNNEFSQSIQNRLRSEHNIYMNTTTGKLLTVKEMELLNPSLSTAKNTPNKRIRNNLVNSRNVTGNNSRVTTPGKKAGMSGISDEHESDLDTSRPVTPSGSTVIDKDNSSMMEEHSNNNTAAPPTTTTTTTSSSHMNELPNITYNPTKLTTSTLYAEILPLLHAHGQDRATMWIEWVLTKSGPISFGFLGQSCIDPLSDMGFNLTPSTKAGNNTISSETNQNIIKNSSLQEETEKELFVQIHERLLELDNYLSTTTTNATTTATTTNNQNIHIEYKIIIYFLLIKISIQLKLKKEITQYLLLLEEKCKTLRRLQYDSIDSIVYTTLYYKYVIEFEEYIAATQSLSDLYISNHLHNKVLPLLKQYKQYALLSRDAYLQRDSIKKLINFYSQISSINNSNEHYNSNIELLSVESLKQLTTAEIDHQSSSIEWIQAHSINLSIILHEEMCSIANIALCTAAGDL